MTVRELRTALREKGAIGEKVGKVPLIHFLAVRYNVDW